jgi:TonB-linked SusC/RagA family outer membrane protein
MKIFYTIILLLTIFTKGFSQTKEITGTVTDKNTGQPVAGVTVSEKGTRSATLTDEAGKFALSIAQSTATVIFSSTGFKIQQVEASISNPVSIALVPVAAELDEVVVTALGIQRGKKELGYAVQTIKSKDLVEVRQPNLVNALAGRVAGVQVTHGSSGLGSSSRIVIRGENSLSGNNQALFVIDGVPISNNVITNNTENNETGFQEVDYGNGAAEISADDIESITVLKGAGAAALYGSRAAAGVVVIKTKDGMNRQGRGVTFNSSFTFENPLRLPRYQNVYGAGAGGKFSYEDGFGAGINDGGLTSFGPAMDGQLIKQFNGLSTDRFGNPVRGADIIARNGNPIQATPFLPHANNVKDFFQTGATFMNNVAFNGGNDQSSFRLSYTNLNNRGIMPNSDLKRNSLAISGTSVVNSKLSTRAFINFIQSSSDNRPGLGYGSENPMYTFNWTGRQVNTNDLKDYWQAGRKDFNQFNSNYLWLDNPYFTAYENTNGFNKKRLIGNASVNYAFTKELSARIRTGADYYHDLRASKRAFSTKRFTNGAYREDEVDYREINTDLLLSYDKTVNANLHINLSAGGNILNQQSNYKSTTAGQLSVPGIYNFGNSKIPLVASQEQLNKKINSLYAFGNFAWKNYLFADLTFRNDWSSTLPERNNSYAYYSGSLSLVLSDVVRMPSYISYSKVRFSAARVGGDTDPYQLNNTFVFNQNYGSTPLLTSSTRLLNPNLAPEKLTSIEAGVEFYFFKDRLGIDATVYQNVSSDQIINLPTSASSGYVSRLINGGTVRSRGVELMLKGTPLNSNNFKWTSFANFSHNRTRVMSLPEGVDQYITGFESLYASTDNTVFFIATPQNGGRVGDMYGTGLLTINGQTVYDAKGFPVRDPKLRNLGNYNPDFIVGFGNEFTYKNISLNMLWDWRQGGIFISRTFSLGSTSGVLESTLPGRENGIIGEGIVNTGTAATPKYEPNTTRISAADYYGQYYNRANEATSVFDASYVKLRQVSLSYSFSRSLTQRLKVESIKLGFILNNALLFTENPNVDPELNAVQGRRFVYGVEDMSYPSSRSYGMNLQVKF